MSLPWVREVIFCINLLDYVYQFKDHLGNIRLSYKDADKDGSISTSEVVEVKDYYPFGMRINYGVDHPNSMVNGRKHNYGFGGKEEQDELGLGWIDITARNYDPALGRWMNLDPLAEDMRRHSPYNYAFDNPIYFIDPDGMAPFGSIQEECCPNPINGDGIAGAVTTAINKAGKKIKNFFGSFSYSGIKPGSKLDQKGEGLSIWGNNNSHENSTQDKGDSKGSVDVNDIPGSPSTAKGTKGLKKITDVVEAFQNGMDDASTVVETVEKTIDVVSDATNDSDTTVTAKFADKIETTEGSLILHSTKDSTATMNKSDVTNFNKQSEISLQKQKEKVDKLLDN
jgi:RHS repeat-associated protein